MSPVRDVVPAWLSAFAVIAALGLPLLLHGPESPELNVASLPLSGRCVGLHPAADVRPELQVRVVICIDQGRIEGDRGAAQWSGPTKPISSGVHP